MPIYEYKCKRCGRFEEFSRHYIDFLDESDQFEFCPRCGRLSILTPSIYAHPVISSIVVEARKEKAPIIDNNKKVTQDRFNAETYRRRLAAKRIEKQKDIARQTRWTSKTFTPGGVLTKYPKNLEKD